jgi:D-alanyl-D-alanine carboxypeptidase/D-alanyl-D-alanine-endopeptidase (penicillin-binding protein 4)
MLLIRSMTVASLIFAVCAEALPLPDKVVKIMQQEKYKHANWGILVRNADTKEVLYEQNSNQLFIPSSTTKIFSVAALLHVYGDDYRFKTPLYARGSVQNGVLQGDLILVGQGDLTMGGRQDPESDEIAFTKFDHIYANDLPGVILTPQDPLNALKQLAKEVKGKGITRIEGDVLVDDRLFETIELRGMVASPIMINENFFDIVIHPTSVNSPASITFRPMVQGYTITNVCKTVATGGSLQIAVSSDPSGKNIRVEGTIPMDQKEAIRVLPIEKPAEFARLALIQSLKEQGIVLSQKKSSQLPAAYAGMQPLAVWTSPPLYEYAKLILKVSHNLGAELVPLLLAARNNEKTFDKGMLELGKFVTQDVKVPADAFVFFDAAGGDGNRLTPQADIQLLEYVRNWPKEQFQRYYKAFPILGVDGSLEDFGKNTPAVGKVYAKTGTGISYNFALGQFFLTAQVLAGYFESKSGQLFEFVIAVNNATMPKIDDIFPIFEDEAQMSAEFYNNTK